MKGIVGIVASRLIETYYRPTVVLTMSNGFVTGSARSVPGFDLYQAIESCSDLLEKMATDEQRSQGLDIADFLLMEDTPQMILQQMIARNPVLQTFIDTFGLELMDAGRAE